MADDTITKRSFTPFLRRFARKFFWMLLVLWGITIVSFVVIHLAPGSPTDMETTLNPLAGEAARRRLDALYGLDRPLYVQYWDWLCRLVHFDFGVSMSADGRPVMDKILERLPLTVGMNVASLILTLLISVPIGVYSACRRNSLFDRIVTVLVYIGFAMPSFWFALLLMLFFGIDLTCSASFTCMALTVIMLIRPLFVLSLPGTGADIPAAQGHAAPLGDRHPLHHPRHGRGGGGR